MFCINKYPLTFFFFTPLFSHKNKISGWPPPGLSSWGALQGPPYSWDSMNSSRERRDCLTKYVVTSILMRTCIHKQAKSYFNIQKFKGKYCMCEWLAVPEVIASYSGSVFTFLLRLAVWCWIHVFVHTAPLVLCGLHHICRQILSLEQTCTRKVMWLWLRRYSMVKDRLTVSLR